ncbi:flavodoxin [Actinomyces sp. 217892]|uniref:flavodoxin n=1 Tax=Actinomyces sp. 217892 TaxID=2927827 RepID=UPI00202E1982|nr:flavodoxin [Actinomyces sp. 217892]
MVTAGALATTVTGAVLAACGVERSDSAGSTSSTTAAAATTSPTTSGSEATTAASPGGSVLVAYYSAQGHTRTVAEAIAQALGAEVFVITPTSAYTEDDLDWRNDSSRVTTEHDNPDRRSNTLVRTTPESWASYDTVVIGYPIWWGGASWAMTGFVTGNDFAGKTVIPFCTSQSSPIGASATELAELAGTGDWQEGKRFAENVSASEVAAWAAGLRP